MRSSDDVTPPSESAADPTVATDERTRFLREIEEHEPRNLLALAAHQVVLRVAWIFKTESVIIPAFLDTIAGAGWIRGCLPVLNRLGQSVPPLLFAERLRQAPQKKWILVGTSSLMALPFLSLSGIWFGLAQERTAWLPAVFLLLYAFFFAITGLNQLVFGTLQGKLIRPHRRGRLMGISGIGGSVVAIFCAWQLLERWLAMSDRGFGYIFTFTGCGFLLAGLLCTRVSEPADLPNGSGSLSNNHFRNAWLLFRSDARFRRLAIVAMLFVTAQLLFPHYQALGREQTDWNSRDLMIWVIVQNAGAGLFSFVAGAIADRFGNRVTVRLEIFIVAGIPLLAVWLTSPWFGNGGHLFWLTFLLLGTIPVTFKTLSNFTLELADAESHSRYLSTLTACMAIPFVFSPLVGLLIDWIGFEPVFVAIAALVGFGGVLTFRLSEPRHELVE